MRLLEKNSYDPIYRLYLTSPFFFPLIASVLRNEQDGVVYVNNLTSPSQVYVEHAFGFAQIFGDIDSGFEQELEQYLLVDKPFHPDKIRLYAPYVSEFITQPKYESLRSWRQRFVLGSNPNLANLHQSDTKISFSAVDSSNVSVIESQFGVVSRFWRNPDDFIQYANAVVVHYEGHIASICYAAARGNNRVEIDVLTLPAYRNLGLAMQVVSCFIINCFELGLAPLWDCFTNNDGSMGLCKSVGFDAVNEPYQFFTINK